MYHSDSIVLLRAHSSGLVILTDEQVNIRDKETPIKYSVMRFQSCNVKSSIESFIDTVRYTLFERKDKI